MAFQDLSLDDMHALLIALHKAHHPDIDISEMSDAWLDMRTLAGAVTDNSAHLKAVKNDLMPDTATGNEQIRWGKFRGLTRKGATAARKDQAMRIFGAATTPVPANIEWNHISGLRFRTGGPSVIGAQGYVDIDIAAIDVGSATRLNKDETLTMNSAVPPGLDEEGRLVLPIDEGGDDVETEEAFQTRIALRWAEGALGGAQADYVQWALAELGIAAAYAYPLRGGLGTVHLAALHEGSGDARILTAPEAAVLEAVVNLKRPVAHKKGFGFRVLKVIAQPTSVEAKVRPNGKPETAFDWDDSSAPTAHAATPWDGPNRKMQFSGGSRPDGLLAGHRIIIGDGATGAERVVEALDGADAVILEVDEAGDIPIANSPIFAGGPLVAPAREAILDLIDNLGTANPDTKDYGEWEGNLDPGAIDSACRDVVGVKRVEVVTPAAMVEANDPEYPDDDEIGLITPARIVVREMH